MLTWHEAELYVLDTRGLLRFDARFRPYITIPSVCYEILTMVGFAGMLYGDHLRGPINTAADESERMVGGAFILVTPCHDIVLLPTNLGS